MRLVWVIPQTTTNGTIPPTIQPAGFENTPHLLPTRGAARVGLVLLLGALLTEVVSAVGHDGVTEPLAADDASERKVVVALHLFHTRQQKNDNAVRGQQQ